MVAATGPYQEPLLPVVSAALPAEVVQVHSSRYRNPGALPPGAVLVVGSGASGCQIVEDLLRRRPDRLPLGGAAPARVRAATAAATSSGGYARWARWIRRIAERPDARQTPNPLVTGAGGGHDIDLRDYADRGVVLLGHLRGAGDARLHFDDDLDAQLAKGDEGVAAFTRAADDEHARGPGSRPAPEPPPRASRRPPLSPRRFASSICAAAGVTAVVWATGFRADFGWIDAARLRRAPASPMHRRGCHRLRGPLLPRPAVAAQAQVVGAVRRRRRRPASGGPYRGGATRPRPGLIRRASCPSSSSA